MQKYKIVVGAKTPTEREMLEYKDFSSVLKAHNAFLYKKLWLKIGGGSFLAASVLLFFLFQSDEPSISKNLSAPAPTQAREVVSADKAEQEIQAIAIKPTDKMVTAPSDSAMETTSPAAELSASSTPSAQPKTSKQLSHQPVNEPEKAIVQENEVQLPRSQAIQAKDSFATTAPATPKAKVQSAEVYQPPVFTEAEPVGGLPVLYQYLAQELKYPDQAVLDKVSGVVVVSFFINAEGKPERLKVLESLRPDCDEEALRLVKNMPLWHPAKANGVPVRTKHSIPIRFNIQQQ